MAVIKTESVALTKSKLAKGFNGDSFNLNGRAVTVENANKGFKAAGEVRPPYYSVVASCDQKHFASGAVTAFNDYIKDVNANKYNAEDVFEHYFNDMDAVMSKCSVPDSRLSIGIICVYEDCVVAAKTGGCHLLRFSDGELFEIALSDDDYGRGYQFIDTVSDGDMFALVGADCASDLDYDGIVTAFESSPDLKVIIRDFFSVIAMRARDRDCSAAIMKLACDTPRTFAERSYKEDYRENIRQNNVQDSDFAQDTDFEAEPPINPGELEENNEPVSEKVRLPRKKF